MGKFEGVELDRTRLADDQAVGVLDLILREVAADGDAGYVHADMSEYNVAVSESGVTVFDWPQSVPTDHENAREFLDRDVENLVSYFRRKHPSMPAVDADAVSDSVATDDFETVRSHTA
jgi:RIO kinase 2